MSVSSLCRLLVLCGVASTSGVCNNDFLGVSTTSRLRSFEERNEEASVADCDGEHDKNEQSQQRVSSPSSTSTAEEANIHHSSSAARLLDAFRDQIVSSHRDGVHELVEWKTLEWHYYAGYESFSEVSMDACPRTSPKIRKPPKKLPKAAVEKFEWDDEQDAALHLTRLEQGCSNDASTSEFKQDCLEFIRQLIYDPFCTTRFDSRVQCQRGSQPLTPHVEGTGDLVNHVFANHFSDDTLNVLIVGGGPVGLYLANALAMFGESSLSDLEHPAIRVAVMENRLEADGIKLPYTRNWDTELELSAFEGAIDPRLVDIFQHISNGRKFSLPINALETLLLLSNRDKGVKLVYGNVTDYTELLSAQPNLVVFDATGHRLTCLVRGDDCPRPEPIPGILQDVAAAEEVHYDAAPPSDDDDEDNSSSTYDAIAFDFFQEYNHLVEGRQKGEILYPVAEDGTPFSTWWLHVNYFDEEYEDMDEDEEEAEGEFWIEVSSKTDLCVACQSAHSKISKERPRLCRKSCHLSYSFGTSHLFRDDIADYLEDSGEKQWISLAGATINLSREQAKVLLDLIAQSEYSNNPVGIPLDLVPLEQLSDDSVFQEDHLLGELATAREYSTPFVSVFQHRPYVYRDGEIQGDLFGATTPILRMGDSLMVGDFNHATGLTSHIEMVRGMLCRMQNLELGDGYECEEPE